MSGKEYGTAAVFNGTVYIGAVGDVLRAYQFNGQYLTATPTSVTQTPFVFPGVTPAISNNAGAGAVVWAFDNVQSGAEGATQTVPGVLRAYEAGNLAVELYDSNQAPNGRDQFGPGNKFIVPTVAGGKVFVGTTNSVAVFGLLAAGSH